MGAINVLWVDSKHLWVWKKTITVLNSQYGLGIEILEHIEEDLILSSCFGKHAVVIHCGTFDHICDIENLINRIKAKYPKVKVGLETNAPHPHVDHLVDFYVDKPTQPPLLAQLISNMVGIELPIKSTSKI